MNKLVSIVIINYNTKNLLEGCIQKILDQTYPNIEIFFIDNDSRDGSVEHVKGLFRGDERLTVIANSDNKGYSGAANQGIELAKGDYIVITNPDIRYEPEYFEHAVAKMEQDRKIAALTGKIKKYDFENDRKTNLIDTVGLFIYRNRRVIDDGQGLEDDGRFDQECEVFGVSGACPLYRKEALEDAKIDGEYLDNDFFMYKEDVDISWRFRLLGWKCWYSPKALAYHGRGTGVQKRFTTKELLNERKKLSTFAKKFSYTNQRLMEVKNDLFLNVARDVVPMMGREIAALGYITLREPYLWKSVLNFWKRLPRALRKRRLIMEKKRVSAQDMEKWFQSQSKYVKQGALHQT